MAVQCLCHVACPSGGGPDAFEAGPSWSRDGPSSIHSMSFPLAILMSPRHSHALSALACYEALGQLGQDESARDDVGATARLHCSIGQMSLVIHHWN